MGKKLTKMAAHKRTKDKEIQDSHKKEEKCTVSADAPDDQKRSDPLCLTSLVVDKILEDLDDPSLLTGRLVCQSWNAEITSRNHLWKQRCQRKPVFQFDLNTTPLDDVFHQYVLFHHVYHRMRSGDAFQVDQHSEALDCYHGAREDRSLSRIFGTVPEESDAASPNILPRHSQPRLGINATIALTSQSELVMSDLQTEEEMWRHENVELKCFDHSYSHIFAVTSWGVVKRFSLDGRCEYEIYSDGKLTAAIMMSVHPSGCFILVELENDEVYLVDVDNNQVIHLTFPEIPEDEKEEDNNDDDEKELCCVLGFLSEERLSNGQLAVYWTTKNCMVVAVISKRGKIVHQAYETCIECIRSVCDVSESHMIIEARGQLKKYSICCKSSGIQITLMWQKPVPKLFRSGCHGVSLICCGDQFIVGIQGRCLMIFRLDNGRLVCSVPGFFKTRTNRDDCFKLTDAHTHSLERMVRSVEIDRSNLWRHDVYNEGVFLITGCQDEFNNGTLFFANTNGLNGLSPSSTKPNVPVLLFISEDQTDIRCLRWSADLWTGADL